MQRGIGEIVEFQENNFAIPIEESVAREIIMEMKSDVKIKTI